MYACTHGSTAAASIHVKIIVVSLRGGARRARDRAPARKQACTALPGSGAVNSYNNAGCGMRASMDKKCLRKLKQASKEGDAQLGGRQSLHPGFSGHDLLTG